MSKGFIAEYVANFFEWGLQVIVCTFLASVMVPYWTGFEVSQSTALAIGLLLERALAAFYFVHTKQQSLSAPESGDVK